MIGYDISKKTFGAQSDVDLLYTLVTRAMHDLTLIGVDQLSPLIVALPTDIYTTLQSTKQSI